MYDYIIIGAGLTGLTLANLLVKADKKILLVERDEIGGLLTKKKKRLGSLVLDQEGGTPDHCGIPHIYSPSNQEQFNFMKQFGEWIRLDYNIDGVFDGSIDNPCSNIHNTFRLANYLNNDIDTIDKYNAKILKDVKKFLSRRSLKIDSLEYTIVEKYGQDIWDMIVVPYLTNVYPNTDPKYFNSDFILPPVYIEFGYIPKMGYEELVSNMIMDKNIDIRLGEIDVDILIEDNPNSKIIYTGSPDELMKYEECQLPYTTSTYKKHGSLPSDIDMRYTFNFKDPLVNTIKIFRNGKFFNDELDNTYTLERSDGCYNRFKSWQLPLYPIAIRDNRKLFETYVEKVHNKYKSKVILAGRLGLYKYFTMGQAIENAKLLVANILKSES